MARVTRYLLDTNVLSEPVRQQPDPRLQNQLRINRSSCATASVVWHELCFGCQRLPDSKRKRVLQQYLDDLSQSQLTILPYDQAAASRHAQFRAQLEANGISSGPADGQIAAIALLHGLTVVTRNVRHFKVFPDLAVENWFS
jgi:tRNA(fMet)-specific endonuclease VapC